MKEAFVIQWKSTVNGRVGKGTKIFNREAGEELIQELNNEYPEMVHELVIAPQVSEHPEDNRPRTSDTREKPLAGQNAVSASEPPQITTVHSFPD
jgi:hypothetical protein